MRRNQPLIQEFIPIVLHQFSHRAQSSLQKLVVIRNPPSKHHDGIERLRVGHDDVLNTLDGKQIGRPIKERMARWREACCWHDADLLTQVLGQSKNHVLFFICLFAPIKTCADTMIK